MTQPVQEPTSQRVVSKLGWGQRQLERRPGQTPLQLDAVYTVKVFSDTQTVTTGDGKFKFDIDEDLDQWYLTRVMIYITTVSSSGIVQVQLRNATDSVDMLSTRIQIDTGDKNSRYAATAYVINVNNAQVSWADEINIDVDAAGTGATGLGCHLTFSEFLEEADALFFGNTMAFQTAVNLSNQRRRRRTQSNLG